MNGSRSKNIFSRNRPEHGCPALQLRLQEAGPNSCEHQQPKQDHGASLPPDEAPCPWGGGFLPKVAVEQGSQQTSSSLGSDDNAAFSW
ncbi:hypothetical protein CHARACLAT_028104 [Characodon lateralis]|uniref:Uncharacterized protein n=1 Tax=Characodon lateralis TaxID=208331 RepID=A0ABU7D1B7_9TELE|nr:hypothetical protein [Characodon lateralis]